MNYDRKKNKRTLFILLTALLLTLFISCRGKDEETHQSGVNHSRSSESVEDPKTMAVLFAPAAHAVMVLGCQETIVGIPHGLSRDRFVLNCFPRLAGLPILKRSEKIFFERLLLLKPEVVIGSESDQENSVLQKLIKGMGSHFIMYQPQPGNDQSLAFLAKNIGAHSRYLKLKKFNSSISQLVQPLADSTVSCYFSVLELERTLQLVERGWLTAAGYQVVPEKKGRIRSGKYVINPEVLYAENPQWIFVIEDNAYLELTTDPRWAELQAVKMMQIVKMPVGFSRWGHPNSIELSLATLFVASYIDPARVSNDLVVEKCIEFYHLFLDIKLTEQDIKDILNRKWNRTAKGQKAKRKHLNG